MVADIDEKHEALRLQRKELEDQQQLDELTIEYVCNFMDKRDANLESKRALQKLMFPNGLHVNLKTKKCRTEDLSPLYSVINTKKEPEGSENANMVIPAGVEPAIFWMRTRRPRPLDDGTIFVKNGDLEESRTPIDGMKTRCTNRYTTRPD